MKKIISQKAMMSGLVMFVLLLFVSSFSFASELDDIRAAIKGKHARWTAGETSISKLPPEQRKMRLGLIKPKAANAEKAISVEAPLEGLPASLDWRNNAGDYVTPVRDQGSCGSCWAFATTGALESYTLIKDNHPGMDLDLSEQILVSCSRAGNCGGGYIDLASDFIRDTGLPEEGCYPYTARNGNCRRACSDWGYPYMIDSWSYVTTTSLTADDIVAIKDALDTFGPLVTTMNVYTDFFSYQSGIYSYAWGNYEGGHAILIVGYDDANQYFIVKNSWGTDWAKDEGGFFKIAYSQINPPVEFGDWTIAYHQPSGCTYSISSTTIQPFPASGGSDTINVTVTAGTNCSWTAASNANWITITSVSSSTVQYRVAQNRGKKSRTGTMTVAGQTFTVTQDGR